MSDEWLHWHFLRHADPVVRADVAGRDWVLSQQGRRDARVLATARLADTDRMPLTRVWSSSEPKALETARILAEVCGLPLDIDGGLREQEADLPIMATEDFVALVSRWLETEGASALGTESWNALGQRFDQVIRTALSLGEASNGLVMATHGRWLAAGLPRYLANPASLNRVELWKSLRRPDWVSVRVAANVATIDALKWEIVRLPLETTRVNNPEGRG